VAVTVVVAVHAAIIAINDAVDHCVAMTTVSCLLNPAASMSNVVRDLSEDYQSLLFDAKQIKKEIAFNKVTFNGPSCSVLRHGTLQHGTLQHGTL